MISIIVSGHGEFASAIEKTMEYILGPQKKIHFINFNDEMSNKELEKKYFEIIKKENIHQEEIVFLTDLAGGTPFSTAVQMSMSNPKIKVLGGCNLPMIISTLESREDGSLETLLDDIVEFSKESIFYFKENIKKVDIEIEGI